MKWDQVATAMLKYGCVYKWSKEMVQRKYYEMQRNADLPEYARAPRQFSEDLTNDSFVISRNSHSLQGSDHEDLDGGISTDIRDRANSTASTDYSIEQQVHDKLRFDVQEQQNWS